MTSSAASTSSETQPKKLISFEHEVEFQLDTRTGRPTYGLRVTIKNLTEGPVWYSYRDFRFRDRSSCGMHQVSSALYPGEERKRYVQLKIGDCASLEALQSQREHLHNTGRRRPPTNVPWPLDHDLQVPFNYHVDAWDEYPHSQTCWEPNQTTRMSGTVSIPAGTQSNFCMHHRTTM